MTSMERQTSLSGAAVNARPLSQGLTWRGTELKTETRVAMDNGARAKSVRIWAPRLAAAGWATWDEAVAWAEDNGLGWQDIANRLGTGAQNARRGAAVVGVTLEPRKSLSLEAAARHVREHGDLTHPTGDLALTLKRWRAEARSGKERPFFAQVDALDPDWRLSPKERMAKAERQGREYELPVTRQARLERERKFAAAGWATWDDAVRWAAETEVGIAEIASRLGMGVGTVGRALVAYWQEDPQRLAALGGLIHTETNQNYDNGERLQCRVCAMWFDALGHHIRLHGLTSQAYGTRFALAGDARFGPRRTAPDRRSLNEIVEEALVQHGFEDLAAAVDYAVAQKMTQADLVRHLGVSPTRLQTALKRAGLTVPTFGERMLERARAHVAGGGNLSFPPDREMGRWLVGARRSDARGKPSAVVERLDEIDPLWRLTEDKRAAHEGCGHRYKKSRAADARWAEALRRRGFQDTDEAVGWLRAVDGSPLALSIKLRVPRSVAGHRVEQLGLEFSPQKPSGVPIERELRAVLAHIDEGGDVGTLPDGLRRWLIRRRSVTREAWVARLLNEEAPGWRTVEADECVASWRDDGTR